MEDELISLNEIINAQSEKIEALEAALRDLTTVDENGRIVARPPDIGICHPILAQFHRK